MSSLRIFSAAEQVASHLRSEIAIGSLSDSMPGVNQLSSRLGVNHKTVCTALKLLEQEGTLVGQGPRRARRIASQTGEEPQPMRISIFLYETSDRQVPYFVELQHALLDAGHIVSYAPKTLTELRMNVASVESLVKKTEVDAWVVVAGSREVLKYFIEQPAPAFALFGRRSSLPIASTGPDSDVAVAEAINHLIANGHRRIVKVCRSERRKPGPGKSERTFLEILRTHKIPTGEYNLPDWEETPQGLHRLLESLFGVTPPTALIFDEATYFIAALQFFGSIGLRVPEDVSLFCSEYESKFDWCIPSIAHVSWDSNQAIRRIVRWAAAVGQGKADQRCTSVPSKFVKGGTIGLAPLR